MSPGSWTCYVADVPCGCKWLPAQWDRAVPIQPIKGEVGYGQCGAVGRSIKGKERASDLMWPQKEGHLLLVCSVFRDSVAVTRHCSYSKGGLLMSCLVNAAISMGDLGTGRDRNGGKTGPRLALLFRVTSVLTGPRHLLPRCLCLRRAFPSPLKSNGGFLRRYP